MKHILVTGGAGFLGANLCHKLLNEQADAEVYCLDNFFTGRRENLADIESEPRFHIIEHDIVEPLPASVTSVKFDEIYNLACPASPPAYQADPVKTTKTSVFGILHMLDLAKACGAKILQASTSEVYGEPQTHPQVESYRGNVSCIGIRACYDEGKRCAESLMFDYHRQYGVRTKVIRIFNTYGPLMDPKDGRVVSNFIMQSLKNEDITIYGDGSQTRSLCYVDDLLEGMVRMMASADDFTGPVNLGNPEEQTIKDIAEKIQAITGTTEKLGWSPKVPSMEGLKKAVAYFRTQV